eukprot:m.187592 g.187592  ORF g.187592 m.187592 type:complete len:2651 (+) comp39364_c0_seq1:28-7980(+)
MSSERKGSSSSTHRTDTRSHLFETQRIKVLADERQLVQKKTFTKWVNSHLAKITCRIEDLNVDLRDGKMLIRLLEVLSGEKLPRPARGNMRIHKLENTGKALDFLKKKDVHMENMGPHDIVDGNPRLTLGLIWTIILRFQIQDIAVEVAGTESAAKRSAKDALLLWCQRKTAGYRDVHLTNFTTSWRDGLAFNAIIHKHRPDLIRYDSLRKEEHKDNLNNAFVVAERDLGLMQLLDAEDVDVDFPDERSVMTYVVTYYHYFSKMKSGGVGGRRIAKVVSQVMDNDQLRLDYERLTSELLAWIQEKTNDLEDRSFPNSLAGMQSSMAAFNQYRTQEKPPKFVEMGNLEVMLFDVQTKLRANSQHLYVPPEGKLVSHITKAWDGLETAEHEREIALREELMRQKKLQQLAQRFDKKASMRETWLTENQRLVATDTLGDDVAAVEASIKKHEAIETDIKAYEERVTGLTELASELETGGYHDISRIQEQKININDLWAQLLALLESKRRRLQTSMSLYKVFQEMLDLIDYMDEIKVGLLSDDYGKHLAGVEDLLQKHSLVEADVAAIADRVTLLIDSSKTHADLVLKKSEEDEDEEDGFRADPALIAERQDELTSSYAELQMLASERRSRLEDSLHVQQFYRDAGEEEAWMKEQEQILEQVETENVRDMTGVQHLERKQQALEADMIGHERQVQSIAETGNTMLLANHYASPTIKTHVSSLEKSWSNFRQLVANRRHRLEQLLVMHQYLGDAQETIQWLSMMEQVVGSQEYGRDEYSTQALMKKHVEAQEDLLNYEKVLSSLQLQFAQLAPEDKSGEAVSMEPAITRQYGTLIDLSNARQCALVEALERHEFLREAELVESWIADKKAMVLSLEMGTDVEEAERLSLRLGALEQEVMVAGESQVKTVNAAADRLVKWEHPNGDEIHERMQQVNASWEELVELLQRRKMEAATASGLQELYHTVDETIKWINEKKLLLDSISSPQGKDLDTVMKEQRHLQAIERDLLALADKVATLDEDATKLVGEHPEASDAIQSRMAELKRIWNDLNDQMRNRREQLGESGNLQVYLQDLMAFQSWMKSAQERASLDDLASSVSQAEEMLKQHRELHAEMNAYKPTYEKISSTGHKIIPDPQTDETQEEAQRRLGEVERDWTILWDSWESRQELLQQCLTYQAFKKDAEHAEVLLGEEETYLSEESVGESLDEAEGLLKKHEAFEERMAVHDDSVDAVVAYGKQLVQDEHFAQEEAKKTAEMIDERRQMNREKAGRRKVALEASLALFQFHRDADELEDWISEKKAVASDESYRDPSNMLQKLKKHEAFEAELDANKPRLDKIQETGTALADKQPDSAPAIQHRLDNLHAHWTELETDSKGKDAKLRQANDQADFSRACDDFASWLTDADAAVRSDDVGRDIPSVNNLIKKHQMVEADVSGRKPEIERLGREADSLAEQGHFDAPAVAEKRVALEEAYLALEEPLEVRKKRLEDSKKKFQFNRDVDEELAWIGEKMVLASSEDYGSDAVSVQRLQRKNQLLSAEVEGHEPMVAAVCETADCLMEAGHESSPQIEERKKDLQEQWGCLGDATAERKKRLDESALAQQYFLDVAEAEAWMSEQELYMMDDNRGKDEASALALLKKHRVLHAAVDSYGKTVDDLRKRAEEMITSGNPSSDTIQPSQANLDALYDALKELAEKRGLNLDESYKLFQLNREVEEFEAWVGEKETVAQSRELGQDFEHCEMIREKFSEFARSTTATGTERLNAVNGQADSLIESDHSEKDAIQNWKTHVKGLWEGLLELIEKRTMALSSAYEIKRFYRDVDDLKSQIQEKSLALPEDLGRDVASVETLLRNHENFERDLAAIGSQLTNLSQEAAGLIQTYPDENTVAPRQEDVETAWENLQEKTAGRKRRLKASDDFQKFLAAVKTVLLWTADMRMRIFADEPAKDVAQAEICIAEHLSWKAEIEARQSDFEDIQKFGDDLGERGHYASKEIKAKMQLLATQRDELWKDWSGREEELRLFLEVHIFARDAHTADRWLSSVEQHSLIEDVGETADEVDGFLKKHEDFVKSLEAQEERFAQLKKITEFEQRQQALQPSIVLSTTGIGQLSNRQPIAQGHIHQEIERIEKEARASPQVKRKVEMITSVREVSPTLPDEEVAPSTRASMIVHSDVSSDRSSGGLDMTADIEEALSREIPLDREGASRDIRAEAEAMVAAALEKAEKEKEKESTEIKLVTSKVETTAEVSNDLEVEHEHKPTSKGETKGRKIIQSSAKMPFVQDFKLQPVTTITIKAHCPGDSTRFWIRLQESASNIAFSFMPVFADRQVVLSGGDDEIRVDRFPFAVGEDFELKIVVEESEYRTHVNGDEVGRFAHRISPDAVKELVIGGDPDGKGSIVLLALTARAKKKNVSSLARSGSGAKKAPTSPPPAPPEKSETEVATAEAADETPSTGRPGKHVSFSEEVEVAGQIVPAAEKSVSPLPEVDVSEGGFVAGLLQRKHEMEATGKKSHNRSWRTFYVWLKEGNLHFYKDEREAASHHNPSSSIQLTTSEVMEATDYTKRKFCFRLKTSAGGEWLFQAKHQENMKKWIRAIESATSPDEQRTVSPVSGETTAALPGAAGSAETTPVQSPSRTASFSGVSDQDPKEQKKEKRRSLFGRKK